MLPPGQVSGDVYDKESNPKETQQSALPTRTRSTARRLVNSGPMAPTVAASVQAVRPAVIGTEGRNAHDRPTTTPWQRDHRQPNSWASHADRSGRRGTISTGPATRCSTPMATEPSIRVANPPPYPNPRGWCEPTTSRSDVPARPALPTGSPSRTKVSSCTCGMAGPADGGGLLSAAASLRIEQPGRLRERSLWCPAGYCQLLTTSVDALRRAASSTPNRRLRGAGRVVADHDSVPDLFWFVAGQRSGALVRPPNGRSPAGEVAPPAAVPVAADGQQVDPLRHRHQHLVRVARDVSIWTSGRRCGGDGGPDPCHWSLISAG